MKKSNVSIPDEQRSFGALTSKTDVRDYKLIPDVNCIVNFPDEFELKMVRVKDQGAVSSCVAFSISEVLEYFNLTQNNDKTQMSTGYIYGNRRNSSHKDNGMYTRQALSNAVNCGDVTYDEFPYNVEVPEAITLFENQESELKESAKKHTITTYYRVSSITEIKQALINHGPVVFAVNWYSDYKLDDDFLFSTTFNPKNLQGGHCMVIYGWNKKGWKVLNSWGKSFGNKGTFIYPYEYPIKESWGINSINTSKDDDIDKPFKTKLGQFFAKILNCLIRFVQIFRFKK